MAPVVQATNADLTNRLLSCLYAAWAIEQCNLERKLVSCEALPE
jgi:hypothetical protein